MLARHGYGVLLFDRRGEGESDGDPNAFGWQGERDVHAAVAFLQRRADVDPQRIGGIGLSVGGEMLIEAAAESHELKAVVSEGSSGRSVRDDLANSDKTTDKIGSIASSGVTIATAVFNNNLPPASLESLVPKIAPRSVFFIYALHGQNGTEKRPNLGFYAAASQPKQIWEVPEGPHIGGIRARPAEYERRVVGFFDRALLPRS
jgi:dienelactone hydrolase